MRYIFYIIALLITCNAPTFGQSKIEIQSGAGLTVYLGARVTADVMINNGFSSVAAAMVATGSINGLGFNSTGSTTILKSATSTTTNYTQRIPGYPYPTGCGYPCCLPGPTITPVVPIGPLPVRDFSIYATTRYTRNGINVGQYDISGVYNQNTLLNLNVSGRYDLSQYSFSEINTSNLHLTQGGPGRINGRYREWIIDDGGAAGINSTQDTIFAITEITYTYDSSFTLPSDIVLQMSIDSVSSDGTDYTIVRTVSNIPIIPKYINLQYLLQTNYPILDTMRVYLANSTAPFQIVDSSTVYPEASNSNYVAYPKFTEALTGSSYYVIAKHRNSIETWSANPVTFNADTISYDFTALLTSAYGNNMKLVSNSPVRYGFYSGDVNQDGLIDLSDIGAISNSGAIFATGYIVTDLNGDSIVDLTDLTIAQNNGNNFITVIKP